MTSGIRIEDELGRHDGLSSEEASRRLAVHGRNELVPPERHAGAVVWIWRALTDPMAVLLIAAAVTYFLIGNRTDAAVSLAALVPIVAVSVLLEARAEKALAGLRRLTSPSARVWRDGRLREIPATEIVPGDVLVIEEGDVVPADGRVLHARQVAIDEATLSGEWRPVDKSPDALGDDGGVFAGTTVVSGRGVARVTATGLNTRYGEIGRLLASIKAPPTPLQRAIRHLVIRLGAVASVFCLGVVIVELAYRHGWGAAIIAGVSLAIAAIPEEFPLVFTLYMALGAWRLARERALVRQLAGVETLGSTTVICTDKTGTLTLGDVRLTGMATPTGRPSPDGLSADEQALLEAAVLASEPRPLDRLDQAVLGYARTHQLDVDRLHSAEFVDDYPFDTSGKYVTHVWRRNSVVAVASKGALEGMLERTRAAPEVRAWATAENARMAAAGARVIAVAAGETASHTGDRAADERSLRLLGLLAFSDPVRPGVEEALHLCREAGIRVVMVTGDHPATAHAVADELDLPHDDAAIATGGELDRADEDELRRITSRAAIFARTRPEQKYRLVQALRAQGQVVAMTGDGVNDAPALRAADIGIAMGQRGTEVAREAAAMVLLDDNFATIVRAVRNGRRIFDNLTHAFSYLVAFHAPLLLAAFVVPLLGAPLLLMPVHLVVLELFVHPAVSLVFESEPGAADLMRRPPRPPAASLLSGARLGWPLAEGLVLFLAVLALYLVRLAQNAPEADARATAFVALLVGQLALLVVELAPSRPVWKRSWRRANLMLPAVILATLLALALVVSVPAVAGVLQLQPLAPREWLLAIAVALVATLWREPAKILRAG